MFGAKDQHGQRQQPAGHLLAQAAFPHDAVQFADLSRNAVTVRPQKLVQILAGHFPKVTLNRRDVGAESTAKIDRLFRTF